MASPTPAPKRTGGPTANPGCSMREIIQTCGDFPTDEAAVKLVYLALTKVEQRWPAGPTID